MRYALYGVGKRETQHAQEDMPVPLQANIQHEQDHAHAV